MRLSDIFPTADQLKLITGIESKLLRRRRAGTIGGIAAVAWGIIQVLLSVETSYLSNIGKFLENLFLGQWGQLLGENGLQIHELVGILFLIAALGIYYLFRWTSFLVKESEESFRYTFSIEPFERVKDTPGARLTLQAEDRFHLLHHDLRERLNNRIKRFSLLDEEDLSDSARKALISHIHIRGWYVIREEKRGDWVVHVMPRIRIGPPGEPETLAVPVKFKLTNNQKNKMHHSRLDSDRYNHIVEGVYSSIATEVYRQIESDVKKKATLFPTRYLRAVALFHEAEDFARSNTIDAYDRAITVYSEALRYFKISNVNFLTEFLIKMPLIWRREMRFKLVQSRVQIGYALCLIYRRIISALSGRYKNTLFEIPGELNEAIEGLIKLHNRINKKRLKLISLQDKKVDQYSQEKIRQNRRNTLMAFLTFPRDTWLRYISFRPSQSLFEKQKRTLFYAFTVGGLAYYYLGAIQKAKDYLNDAKNVAPAFSERNALYLLASAVIEPDLAKTIFLLRQATENAPEFEIAQYLLAYNSEIWFRRQDDIVHERANIVTKEYDEVLKINPGNIAALAAKGYLLWLLMNNGEAEKQFENGYEIKAIVRQTFIGELSYGLARIAAERGDFDKSYNLYVQAISADPGVGAYSYTSGSLANTSYYEYIGLGILERYKDFKKNVERQIKKTLDSPNRGKKKISPKIVNRVHSFVLNDYANACLNYFLRTGDRDKLEDAVKNFDQAIKIHPQNKIFYYNVQNAYMWRGNEGDLNKGKECLQEANKYGPTWDAAVIALARFLLRNGQENITKIMEEAEGEIKLAMQAENEMERIQESLFGERITPLKSKGRVKGREASSPWDRKAWKSETVKASKLLSRVLQEHGNVQKHKQEAIQLYNNAKEESEKIIKEVLPRVNEIMEMTKLSSIFEGPIKVKIKMLDQLLSIKGERLDENDIRALSLLAEVLSNYYGEYYEGEKNDQALKAAEKLSTYILEEFYPEDFDVHLNLQNMYLNMKRFYRLDLELNEETKENEKYEEKYEKSYHQLVQKLERCTEMMISILENWFSKASYQYVLKGLLAENYNLFGNVHYENADSVNSEEAREFYTKSVYNYKKAIEYRRDRPVYYANLGGSLRELGRWEEAESAYSKAIKLEPDNDYYQNGLGNIYYGSGKFAESIVSYTKAIDINPKEAVYHANLALGFMELGRWEEAINAYRKAIELVPNNAEYQNMLGNAYYASGEYAESVEQYEKAIKNDPKEAIYRTNLGGSLKELGRWEEAIDAYRKAIELAPNKAEYLNMLGNVYHGSGDYERSLGYYTKAIEIDPKVAVYRANLGGSYKELGRWEEAEKAYGAAIKLEPDNDYYQNGLGNIYYGNGKFAESIVSYTKAIDINPKEAVYHANLGLGFMGLERWEEAIDAYRKTIELEPDNAGYQNMLGNAYYASGEYAKSIKHYKNAIDNDPNVAVYHANLGLAFRDLKKWDEAEAAYTKAVDLEPSNAEYWNMLGNVYLESGDHEKSLGYYTKAIEIDPKVAVYRANLGGSYRVLGRWDEAEKAYSTAIELEPNNADYHDMLGDFYYENGNYDRAAEKFSESIRINPDVPTYASHLILACEKIDNPDKALFLLGSASKYKPDNIELAQAIERFRERMKS